MQLKLHEFLFDNVFAYGEGNLISFDEARVTQIIGANGSGKSSIPGALEELLYNKNSRGVKKASVKNRYSDNYSMKATFSIGDDFFEVEKIAKSTAKVKLLKNGQDISGHTATQTYKILEKEIGLDFSTFSKLVYQSMKSSLDFLTATDTNRKKFLVGLLGLEEYEKIESQLKEYSKDCSNDVQRIKGALDSTSSWLSRHSSIPDLEETVEIPEFDETLTDDIANLRAKVSGTTERNERIGKQKLAVAAAKNKHKKAQQDLEALGEAPEEADDRSAELQKVNNELSTVKANMATEKATYVKFKDSAENTECPTCGSSLDVTEAEKARDAAKARWLALRPERDKLEEQVTALEAEQSKHKTYANYVRRSETLTNMLQSAEEYLTQTLENCPDYETEPESVEDLEEQLRKLTRQSQQLRREIDRATEHNSAAEQNNAKREQILEQLDERRQELQELEKEFELANDKLSDYKVLTKAFGAKGLVAYKIESSIKSLEETLNEYLSELTAGQFALGFELSGTKLDVVVYDNSELVEVNSLSSGEFANVQVATLLAIRKILSTLNSVDINVLFLDEIISVIDPLGRDRLVDLLQKETELNTFLVSHGYEHPLTNKLYVSKEDGFSRINKNNG